MELKYDVVIVGAGTTGLYAAYKIASAGFRVAVIEVKDYKSIGKKVCGDAIGKHHLDRLGLNPPPDVIEGVFRGVLVYSPNMRGSLLAEGEGYALDRYKFGRWLLKLAEDAGAEVFPEHKAIAPIVEGSFVKGVKVLDLKSGSFKTFKAKVTVDASGVTAVVRMKLPRNWWVSEKGHDADFNIAYREVVELEERYKESNYAFIYLSTKVAPGGYWWFFPKRGGEIANVGIGVIKTLGISPKINYEEYIKPRIKCRRVLDKGGGIVPTRRAIATMVWNGFSSVGDAAYTANPMHGGGIGSGLLSAEAAAEAITNALTEGDVSMEKLWIQNIRYIEYYGKKQAKLDLVRMMLQTLSDSDLNFIINSKVISDKDLTRLGMSGATEVVEIAHRNVLRKLIFLLRPRLVMKLRTLLKYIRLVDELYMNYPKKPEEFPTWYSKYVKLFTDFAKDIKYGEYGVEPASFK